MVDANFEYADSRWQDIYLHLKKSGFDVYSPGVKTGDCTKEYIDLYAVMCYVPKQAYSTLEPLVQKVKKAMKELEPMIMPYGSQTPSYYDDSYKAHMISIEYKNHKKIL